MDVMISAIAMKYWVGVAARNKAFPSDQTNVVGTSTSNTGDGMDDGE